ncbi:hypothetical protein ACFQDN_14590 [Pseudomonas asuensis]|uniref:GIY-YIG nuclease family protein n=1 Tax=Pseudomonas asuensis TaxID=1825787 RepID=A0ABQ2H0P9_9PSED|nr:hypothetical protein [Pseudomonas asuensis]GGM23792.1 hypothetical protein GCM10009425_38350 [Pseudomonas asuensis]
MHYEQISSLEEFLSQVERRLLDPERRVSVSFPITAIIPWDGDALARINKSILDSVSGSANLYAIFTGASGAAECSLRYLGKTTKKLARQRITNHLFRKHEKTGSKLAQVLAHACDGGTVEIAWIEVHTESLRNYLEEELIIRHPEADWNRENRTKLKASFETSGLTLEDMTN